MVSQRSRSSISLPSPRVAIGHSSTHAVNKLYSILRSGESPDHSASTAPLVIQVVRQGPQLLQRLLQPIPSTALLRRHIPDG
jgi:hypothetical protein